MGFRLRAVSLHAEQLGEGHMTGIATFSITSPDARAPYARAVDLGGGPSRSGQGSGVVDLRRRDLR